MKQRHRPESLRIRLARRICAQWAIGLLSTYMVTVAVMESGGHLKRATAMKTSIILLPCAVIYLGLIRFSIRKTRHALDAWSNAITETRRRSGQLFIPDWSLQHTDFIDLGAFVQKVVTQPDGLCSLIGGHFVAVPPDGVRHVATLKSIGSDFGEIRASDVKNPSAFARRLSLAKDPVSAFIYPKLSTAGRQAVKDLAAGRAQLESVWALVLQELNAILGTGVMCDGNALKCRETTAQVLKRQQSLKSPRLANRLLFEDAYPKDIAIQPEVGTVALLLIQRYSSMIFFGKSHFTTRSDLRMCVYGRRRNDSSRQIRVETSCSDSTACFLKMPLARRYERAKRSSVISSGGSRFQRP